MTKHVITWSVGLFTEKMFFFTFTLKEYYTNKVIK